MSRASESATVKAALEKFTEELSGYEKVNFWTEIPEVESIYALFSEASKTGSGSRGRPDICGYSEEKEVLIILEAKRDSRKSHCNIPHTSQTAPNHLSIEKATNYACSGTRHYMKSVVQALNKDSASGMRRKLKYILGVAVSGKKADKVTFFGHSIQQSGLEYLPRYLGDSWLDLQEALRMCDDLRTCCVPQMRLSTSQVMIQLSNRLLASLHFQDALFQRIIDTHRASKIVESYLTRMKAGSPLPASGCLLVGQVGGELYMVDGQHRLWAYECLLRRHSEALEVVVRVIDYASIEDLRADFLLHNSHISLTVTETANAVAPTPRGKANLLLADKVLASLIDLYPAAINEKNSYRGRMNKQKVKCYLQKVISSGQFGNCDVAEAVAKLQQKELALRKSYSEQKDMRAESCQKIDCWLGYEKKYDWL